MTATSDLKRLIGTHNVIDQRMTQHLLSKGEVNLSDPKVRERMVEVMSKPHHRKRGWHPSSILACKRAQVFEWIGVQGESQHSAQLLAIFADGTWRHLRWQTMLLSAGILTDVEVPVQDEETGLVGSMDGEGEYKGDGFMFELKGIFALNNNLPYENHLWQVNAYLLMRPDLKFCVVVYEDKRSQGIKEFKVYPSAKRQKLIRRRTASLNLSVQQEELPSVRPDCIKEKGDEWKGCEYAGVCKTLKDWKEAEAFAGTSPF